MGLQERLGRKTRRALCSHVTLPDLYTQLYRVEPHPEHISSMLADRAVLGSVAPAPACECKPMVGLSVGGPWTLC